MPMEKSFCLPSMRYLKCHSFDPVGLIVKKRLSKSETF